MNAIGKERHSPNGNTLGRRTLYGAGIALLLGIIFLSVIFAIGNVLNGKNAGQIVWNFFPLITVTVGGVLGGMIFHMLMKRQSNSRKNLAALFSVLIYILIFWLCLIAGFSAIGLWD